MKIFIKIRKFFVILFCFSAVSMQGVKPLSLSSKQKAFVVGGVITLLATWYCYNSYKQKHGESKNYSIQDNVIRAATSGLGVGSVIGGLSYFLLNGFKSGPIKVDLTIPDLSLLDINKPMPGLKNFGTSCFMNAVLQCELNSPQVRRALLNQYPRPVQSNEITALFTQTLHEGLSTVSSYISPTTMHAFIRQKFFPGQSSKAQHDSADFSLKLIDDLIDINYLYEWQETSIMQCNGCRNRSQMINQNRLLMLPITENPALLRMLQTYYANEFVADHKCTRCDYLGVTKEIRIDTVPRRLLIQLKRFKIVKVITKDSKGKDIEEFKTEKVNTPVSFPLQVNLPGNNTEYYLQGFHVHRGATLKGGHYVAYVKDPVSDQWYLYDDSNRRNITNAEIANILNTGLESSGGTPFVLCYEQKIT